MSFISRFNKRLRGRSLPCAILDFTRNKMDQALINLMSVFSVSNNRIVMESEGDYTDNIRALYEYMIENEYNNEFEIIWFVHNPRLYSKVKNVKFVSRFHRIVNIVADYYIATAKLFVFSHPYWLTNWRKNQIVVSTTHSAAQLKKMEPQKKKIVDYALACSESTSIIKQQYFGLDHNHVLVIGMPRIDLLFKHKDCFSLVFGKEKNMSLILVMETFRQTKSWRDSEIINPYSINVIKTNEELIELDKFLETKNTMMIVKVHHLQDLSFLSLTDLSHIRFITDYDLQIKNVQVNELLENADMLLTDYSSVFYEYLLLNRPIGFLTSDISEYSRGYITNNIESEMPGEKIKNLEELKAFIEQTLNGYDKYSDQREFIKNKTFKYKDSDNSKRFVEWIKKVVMEECGK